MGEQVHLVSWLPRSVVGLCRVWRGLLELLGRMDESGFTAVSEASNIIRFVCTDMLSSVTPLALHVRAVVL